MMRTNTFLLYGANGYTGELIARYAAQYDLIPLLAGRRKEYIEPLAKKLNLSYRIFDLDDKNVLETVLKEVKLVVHAAGPFLYTAKQMVEACLQTGVHYIDINGDISVFEMIKQYDIAAKKTGIMLLSGAGFDVVPTDCAALQLKKLLPDAVSLQLAFASAGGGLSHGTATTMASRLGEKALIRKDGKLVSVALGKKGMWIDFFNGSENADKRLFVMNIPWGDISTAYVTTGIPNIETFAGVAPKIVTVLKFQFLYNWLLRTKFIRRYIKNKIDKRPAGPGDEQRTKSKSFIWGQATNTKGEKVTVRLSGPDGYTLTTHASLIIAKKILNGSFVAGYQTPAQAYGENLVMEIEGVQRVTG